jgi:hypothetical protein
MLANAFGGFCVDGDAGGVCAEAAVAHDARPMNAITAAAGILMRDVLSNRNAKRVFAETLENVREKGGEQREDPERTPTEMFIRV